MIDSELSSSRSNTAHIANFQVTPHNSYVSPSSTYVLLHLGGLAQVIIIIISITLIIVIITIITITYY
jgi:hypothetical protein